jgi:hypothetical protein
MLGCHAQRPHRQSLRLQNQNKIFSIHDILIFGFNFVGFGFGYVVFGHGHLIFGYED